MQIDEGVYDSFISDSFGKKLRTCVQGGWVGGSRRVGILLFRYWEASGKSALATGMSAKNDTLGGVGTPPSGKRGSRDKPPVVPR